MTTNYANQPGREVALELASPDEGLTQTEAAARLLKSGPNALAARRTSARAMLLRQFANPLVYVLLVAMVVSAIAPMLEEGPVKAGDFADAIVIALILFLNAALGIVQEFRAENAVAALAAINAPMARVRRDTKVQQVASSTVVCGDRLVVEAGDRVVADARVLSSDALEVDESSLTGESSAVSKGEPAVAAEAQLGERTSMLYSGALVTAGEGEAVVTATGAQSQIGRIADLMHGTERPQSPLQAQLAQLGRLLGWIALAALGLVVIVGFIEGSAPIEILMMGLALAVSAVPEGLPAVVTLTFAIGTRRMADVNVLVRRLDSLETLGAIDVIATDKTGTLTENKMTVVETVLLRDDEAILATIGASCNRARSATDGDPTETALVAWAEQQDAGRKAIDIEDVPFSATTRYMQTRHGDDVYVKGAPETLLELTSNTNGDAVATGVKQLADRGLRVLAGARQIDGTLQIVGLWGIEDPPRQGAAESIAIAREAGIRTVMITGDHVDTARSIARRLSIGDVAMTGAEIDALGEDGLRSRVDSVDVYARVAPEHKVAICHALRAQGHVVAMTGDGVNDAPALKAAHVGVAMGKRGTEVAREAAAIVLADDRYESLVKGIREGRRIHDNIRRFVVFLLRANFDELLLILMALLTGIPLPLLPVHILWINVLTDGLPALALAAEPAEPGVMKRPPRDDRQHLLHGEGMALFLAVILGAGSAYAFYVSQLANGTTIEHARTATLTMAILLELLLAFSARSRLPVWRVSPFSNRPLLGAAGIVILLHVLIVHTPMRALFRLTPLSIGEWLEAIAVAGAAFVCYELSKLWIHRPRKAAATTAPR